MTEITRDTVLLAGDDTDEAAAKSLGLGSFPGGGLTLGQLVDEANENRENLGRLLYAVTGGAMSKPGWAEDTAVVLEAAAPVAMREFTYNRPEVLDSDVFRKAIEEWFGAETLAVLDADRRHPVTKGL